MRARGTLCCVHEDLSMDHSHPTLPIAQEWLSARDVATWLGCSVRTVWSMRASGRLPAPVRVGPGLIRWRRRTLEDWFDQLEERPRRHN